MSRRGRPPGWPHRHLQHTALLIGALANQLQPAVTINKGTLAGDNTGSSQLCSEAQPRGHSPRCRPPAPAPAAAPPPAALSAAISSVPPSASAHPPHTRPCGRSPASVDSRGVSSAVAWIRKLARVALVSCSPKVCSQGAERIVWVEGGQGVRRNAGEQRSLLLRACHTLCPGAGREPVVVNSSKDSCAR